jgi:CDP-diacylglycerol--glycerol-3-phosphate 3-phosphatidyltransferase
MTSHTRKPAVIRSSDLTTLPNIVSLARIVGVIVSVSLYLTGHRLASVLIGLVACLTDHLDGYLARRLSQETALGAMLDQAADSFTIALALAMLVVAAGLPFAFLAVFLMREFWVGTVRRYAIAGGIEIPSMLAGKIATATIYWGTFVLAAAMVPQMPAQYVAPLRAVALGGLTAGLGLSCFAGWRYTLSLTGRPA